MIKLFRIDERLIHGQIAIKWSRHTGVDSIVVANDHAAENVMIQKSLKMAAPPGIKTVIKTLDAAIATLNDPRCEPLKVLVLVNSPADALKMVRAVKGIPFVNIGNYGRVPQNVSSQVSEHEVHFHLLWTDFQSDQNCCRYDSRMWYTSVC